MGNFNLQNDSPMRNITGDDYQADLSTVLGETFSYIRSLNPVPLMTRNYERNRSRKGSLDDPMVLYTGAEEKAPDPQIDKNILNEKYKYLGLQFDEDDTEFAAQSIADAKEIELSQQSMMNAGAGGFVEGTAKFGMGLVATMTDPLNIASMVMFPALTGAKFYASAVKNGVTLTRLKGGARSGFLGSVAIEPIVYSQATQEQKDYNYTHSLLNVTAGTILGGGLHVFGGTMKDIVKVATGNQKMKAKITELQNIQKTDLNDEARDVLFKVAMRQFVQGKNIDVEKLHSFFLRKKELDESTLILVETMSQKQLQSEIKIWLKNTKDDPVYKEALKDVKIKLNASKEDLRIILRKLHAVKQGGVEGLLDGHIPNIEKALLKGDQEALAAIRKAAATEPQSNKAQVDLDKVDADARKPDVNIDIKASKKYTDETVVTLQEEINGLQNNGKVIDPDNIKKIKEADEIESNSELNYVALKAAMRCIS
tara:strand:- start:369 stop:1814 length:1446 start_codon:yes stop_codon:yes gene_type:complete